MADFGPNWKWIRDLSEGGQSHTFVVRRADGSDDRQYVLKRLKNLNRRDRFEREISACQKLDHPNILRIVDSDTDPKGRLFLVTEYCGGGSLSAKPMPLGTVLDVLELFRQICAGVAYAQREGIVHRDIKPENIYLREDGTPVVGDFGLCFIDDGSRLTRTEEVVGSRFYCAPELRDGRMPQGAPEKAADVYSLGKVLYWMLSGGRVFDREDHRRDEYILGRYEPGAAEYQHVNQLLDRMLVANPLERILGAELVLLKVEGLMSIIRAGGHPITLAVPHRCIFCAQGEYKVIVNCLDEPANPNKQALSTQDAAYKLFSWASPGSHNWLIMACESCGHIQIFRPDLVPEGLKNWRKDR